MTPNHEVNYKSSSGILKSFKNRILFPFTSLSKLIKLLKAGGPENYIKIDYNIIGVSL